MVDKLYDYNAYKLFTRTVAAYPSDKETQYLTLGVCDEAGELVEKLSLQEVEGVRAEIGDVAWYATRLWDSLQPDGDFNAFIAEANKEVVGCLQAGISATDVLVNIPRLTGAIAGRVKKWMRGDSELQTKVVLDNLRSLFALLALLSTTFKGSLLDLMAENQLKLESRKERGVIKGDGDNR